MICYLIRGPPNVHSGFFFLVEEQSNGASDAVQVSQPVRAGAGPGGPVQANQTHIISIFFLLFSTVNVYFSTIEYCKRNHFGKTQTIKVCSPLVQSSYQGFWSSLFGHLTKSNLVIIFWSFELVLLRNFKSYKHIFFYFNK